MMMKMVAMMMEMVVMVMIMMMEVLLLIMNITVKESKECLQQHATQQAVSRE